MTTKKTTTKTKMAALAGLGVLLVGVIGCDNRSSANTAAANTASPSEAVASPPAAPAPAAPIAKPPLSAEELKGRRLYVVYCLRCHGSDGTGHGPMASMLGRVGNLTDPGLYEKMPPEAMKELVKTGKDKMPAFGPVLKPEEISAVVEFARTFRR